MDKLKKITNLIFGYGISQIIVVLLPILLLPILTRSLTMTEFADYSIYKVILGLSTPLICLALSTYLLKNVYDTLKNIFVSCRRVFYNFSEICPRCGLLRIT